MTRRRCAEAKLAFRGNFLPTDALGGQVDDFFLYLRQFLKDPTEKLRQILDYELVEDGRRFERHWPLGTARTLDNGSH